MSPDTDPAEDLMTPTEKPSRKRTATTARKRAAVTPRPRRRRRQPTHGEISQRAYFIYLEEGTTDEFGNWLRAERELTAA